MPLYYAGFNVSPLFSSNGNVTVAVDSFTEIPFSGITDFQIGWSYFLLWRGSDLYIDKKPGNGDESQVPQLIQIPGTSESCKQAALGKDNIVVLSKSNDIWQYKIYENHWRNIPKFIPSNNDSVEEYCVKMLQGGCTVALTNLGTRLKQVCGSLLPQCVVVSLFKLAILNSGRVFNVPTLVEMPKRVKFVDIACGFDHTVLLANNGDIYSIGMGTRGQLGHGDLEDCDNPRLVEALAGVKVSQISAGGWHSAAVTEQGDLYTWGWNTSGELGLLVEDTKVFAIPTLVDFKNDQGDVIETNVTKVECGNAFTICRTDDHVLWGCGSNKYGQLGRSRGSLPDSSVFVKLDVPLNAKSIRDYKCHEWGTVLVAD